MSSSSSSTSANPDWAWLPENTLFLIISHLFLLSDIFSFGSVCSNWHSISKHRLKTLNISTNNIFFKKGLPLLLIPTTTTPTTESDGENTENSRSLYNPATGATISDLNLSVPYSNRCIGSSHGWLIFIENVSFVVTLFNPFYFGDSKAGTIKLPPFQEAGVVREMTQAFECDFSPDYFICKAILSADPCSCNEDGYIVMVIQGDERRLSYYKSGDAAWTYIQPDQQVFFDIIYHQTYFLAVNFWGEVYTCDVNSNTPTFMRVTEPVPGPLGETTRRYIVGSPDGCTLLQAVRLVHTCHCTENDPIIDTSGFNVYRMQAKTGTGTGTGMGTGTGTDLFEWVPVNSIGDGALFLGDNYSTFVKPSEFKNIISNSIYFTSDYHDVSAMYHKPYQFGGYKDNGIFLIKDNMILNHYVSPPENKNLPPPIWILPTI